jgi:hypothetical protein
MTIFASTIVVMTIIVKNDPLPKAGLMSFFWLVSGSEKLPFKTIRPRVAVWSTISNYRGMSARRNCYFTVLTTTYIHYGANHETLILSQTLTHFSQQLL